MFALTNQNLSATSMWLPWVLLFLLATLGTTLFILYKAKRDRIQGEIIAKAEQQQDRVKKLWRLLETMNWSDLGEATKPNLVRTIKEITGAFVANAYLLDVRNDTLFVVSEESDHTVVPGFRILPSSYGDLPALFEEIKPILIKDVASYRFRDLLPEALLSSGAKSVVGCPIFAGTEVLGLYSLWYLQPVDWTEEYIQFLIDIGRVVGLNLKNAKTSDNLRELAVLKERRYISRELHDNFSQLISALAMRAVAARLSFDEHSWDELYMELGGMVKATQEIQTALREEMIGLYSSMDIGEDLLPSIHTCIERFQQLANISVKLENGSIPNSIAVSTRVASQLIRILQEGLSNVRRHSHATSVVIRLQECNHRLCMEIEDNGQGFNLETIQEDRLGLQIMCERAEEAGGKVSIRSNRGAGTCILVEMPLSHQVQTDNET